MADKIPFAMVFTALEPMLLSERPHDLTAPGWQYEIKFDGYRLMAQFGNGEYRLKSRNGPNATKWFPELKTLADVPGGPHVIDGEVCVLDDMGRSDFNRLHDRAKHRGWYDGAARVTYCVFDLLKLDGWSVMDWPLESRRAALAKLLDPVPENILIVTPFDAGTDMRFVFANVVVPLQLEGLVAKRTGSAYQPGLRSSDWIKIKRKGAVPRERFKPR